MGQPQIHAMVSVQDHRRGRRPHPARSQTHSPKRNHHLGGLLDSRDSRISTQSQLRPLHPDVAKLVLRSWADSSVVETDRMVLRARMVEVLARPRPCFCRRRPTPPAAAVASRPVPRRGGSGPPRLLLHLLLLVSVKGIQSLHLRAQALSAATADTSSNTCRVIQGIVGLCTCATKGVWSRWVLSCGP